MSAEADNSSSGVAQLNAVGGELCLDFTNTIDDRGYDTANDYLVTYADLLVWAEKIGAIDSQVAVSLSGEANRRPEEAAQTLARAIDLREALHRIFVAHTQGLTPPTNDLTLLNVELGNAMANLHLDIGEECCVWSWKRDSRALEQMLWPVIRSAADLLTSDEIRRVHLCANETCRWLFVDRSRNRSRRWCDMKECGNVAKVRRYRRRKEK
jgi:predicted RNA-binding Zn ribbon-like protein